MQDYINILVGRKKLEWIAHRFKLSEHAKVALLRRDYRLDEDLKQRILQSPLSWKTYDGRIAIALDLYSYLIVDIDKGEKDIPVICTYVRNEDVNVIDKMLIAYKDYCRKGSMR